MSKHGGHSGPNASQRAEEYAHAIAAAIGAYSDQMWQTGPWFMEITIVARRLADLLVNGELDERIIAILEHGLPWGGGPQDPGGVMPYKWEPKG